MNTMFIETEEVKEIKKSWFNDKNNILIGAVAGSGKTTTLMHLIGEMNERVLYLAFNRSIKKEVDKKFIKNKYRHGKALTLHSYGFEILKQHFPGIKVDNNKFYTLVNSFARVQSMGFNRKYTITGWLKVFYQSSKKYCTVDFDTIRKYHNIAGIAESANIKSKFKDTELRSIWADFVTHSNDIYPDIIDFDDMVYLPVKLNLSIPSNLQPSYVMIDEGQDLGITQHKLFQKIIALPSVKQWIAVGDPHQAIYLFAGSLSTSFHEFMDYDGVVLHSLSKCYRCPSSIVDEANDIYDIISQSSGEGGIVKRTGDKSVLKEATLVLSRNNSTILSTYFDMLSMGIDCRIIGNEITGRLRSLLKQNKWLTIKEIAVKLLNNSIELSDKIDKDDPQTVYRARVANEDYNLMNTLYGNIGDISANDALLRLSATERSTGAVALSTIHKSKGLESDHVVIINEHEIPSKYAIVKEAIKQEENLKYIARTRAIKSLTYLTINK